MFNSESSTKRFFNKIRRPFQRPSEYYYFDQQNFGPLLPGENIGPAFYPSSYEAENAYNEKLSIIPFLEKAGLDVNKLNHEVIDALNKISIDDDISPQKQKPNFKKIVNQGYMEGQRPFASDSFFGENNQMFEYKNEMIKKQPSFEPPEIQLNEIIPNKPIDSEIHGVFNHFSSDLSWNERKRQLKFKDLAKKDIVSESILKSIDEIIKTNNKQHKQINNLVGNFEKYLNTKNKVYLKPESEEVIGNFIKIFNVKGYKIQTENEMFSFLQNLIFGIYIREGTLKKCHSNVLSAKINGEFASKNNDVDVNFYYEEFQKIQSNFIEDSKNYSDYISEEGSLFVMNMIANNQKYTNKSETCHNEIYSNRFEHLYKQYPQEMLSKLFEYSLRYQVPNWDIFDKFLNPDKTPAKAVTVHPTEKIEDTSLIEKREVTKLSSTKHKKSLTRERKIKHLPVRHSLSLDNNAGEKQLFENHDILNTTNNPNSSYLNSDLNKQAQIDNKDSSKLEIQDGIPLYKAENLETGTAVDPSNKENLTSLTVDEKLESSRRGHAVKLSASKIASNHIANIPGHILS